MSTQYPTARCLALGAWAWHYPASGNQACGHVERRPEQGMSSYLSESVALANAARFAAARALSVSSVDRPNHCLG